MANTFRHKVKIEASGAKTQKVEGSAPGHVWVQADAGPFVGTVAIEISLDGVNFVASSVSPLVTNDYKAIPELCASVRYDCTSYTSGALNITTGQYTPQ